ncbi:hypothetical protein PUN28_003671 [Cardiocondyla obscurior]|uniref:Uncharacterized protein n=1 Tax=Cardiocondyla obscurior TaxID=286306 RepID=A0AAW2GNV8_9HYME
MPPVYSNTDPAILYTFNCCGDGTPVFSKYEKKTVHPQTDAGRSPSDRESSRPSYGAGRGDGVDVTCRREALTSMGKFETMSIMRDNFSSMAEIRSPRVNAFSYGTCAMIFPYPNCNKLLKT